MFRHLTKVSYFLENSLKLINSESSYRSLMLKRKTKQNLPPEFSVKSLFPRHILSSLELSLKSRFLRDHNVFVLIDNM